MSMSNLMEQAVARENAIAAFKRVRRNKGSPGSDGMTVDQLESYRRGHWSALREQLLMGSYQPSAVRRPEIPKSDGGVRILGIPTVLDRFVQQLLLQVLQPTFDPTFSRHSHGFRPGRGAHDGVRAAQRYLQTGRHWVVDVDLERFFDRVNHDVLMGKLQNRIDDPRMPGIDSSLPRRRNDGERGRDGAARGDAARRAALAAVGERALRRSRSRVGATRALRCALRGRLQCVCAIAASG